VFGLLGYVPFKHDIGDAMLDNDHQDHDILGLKKRSCSGNAKTARGCRLRREMIMMMVKLPNVDTAKIGSHSLSLSPSLAQALCRLSKRVMTEVTRL